MLYRVLAFAIGLMEYNHLRNINGLNQSTVRGADVTVLESDKVSRNKLGRLNLLPLAVSLDPSLGGKRVHESLDSVTSVTFLNETNSRVNKKKKDDTDEILPVRGSTTTVRKGDGDEGSTLHNPGERVPHERKELEDDAKRTLGCNTVRNSQAELTSRTSLQVC